MRILRNRRAKFSFLCLIVIGFTLILMNRGKYALVSYHDRLVGIKHQDWNAGIDYQDRLAGIKLQDWNTSIDNQDRHGGIKFQDWNSGIRHHDGNESENHVLLNSYMRSGSSFMGKILGYREDVFYYYEPLWTENIWTYHKGMDKMCHTTTPRCFRRPGKINVSRRILTNVYSCHLLDLGRALTESVHTNVDYGGTNTWEQYQKCKKIGHDKRYCLTKMEEYCRSRTTRVTKVLRLDLSLAKLILQDNPRLKIVHLFRDPRGTMSSHVFTKWFPTKITDTRAIATDAQVYCERVKEDILAAIAFHERYPDKLRGIQYEDFYNLKEKAKLLYDYLGMDSSEKYLNFVLSQFSQETKYNATQIDKSKLFAYRDELPWKVVQIVEKQCADVINLLGLTLYVNEENYKDPEFSPINGQLRFGLSQV